MIDLIELSDISDDLKATPMVEFSGRFFLSRALPSTMPNIGTLVLKYDRQEKGEFDEILAVLKGKLQL